MSIISCTSPKPSEVILPTSSVTKAPSSVLAARNSSPRSRTSSPRRGAGTSRHAWKAVWARAMMAGIAAGSGPAPPAAEELALTHSAVSRQLKALEEQIGVPLFRREGKGLALTPVGADYAASIRDYLQDLARASLRIRAAGSRSSLTLSVLPAFGTHWLLPRLQGFAQLHPEITMNLATRLSPFDFTREKFDAAIHFGGRDWQGVKYLPLAREQVIPAASPKLVPQGQITPERPADPPSLLLAQ